MNRKYDLSAYNEKRDFTKTSEPPGTTGRSSERLRFSFQKHAASTLHYDFRLEVDGVLKSWAVPKGPSTNPQDKRLAIRTEDHPLNYIDFEGVIPEGSYGAGKVLVWDIGTYDNITIKSGQLEDLNAAIKKGHFLIELHGKKLNGSYAMTRMNDEEEQWLLVKMADENAQSQGRILEEQPQSAISGKLIEEMK
ncbi:ATP-dependent DNA ligase clustered with Ku protein, LigD [Fulvivirga imtechensis AK7]|uniref:ATP-dependent DNA ligase clustered with Ku protein, LigD n=1 Tax=Fulvivirga imtechensis AK7 TaxID=1237149 RepID=L8JW87_9BACT|nr:DNA polymerase ligase N-terminal domain-containing protein [Fulvivirga imtechensis]ELR73286.1 ATP-dependent DNA ligase clustered with Ku protein, LigD [Fulvivirga imtechensis AK7]